MKKYAIHSSIRRLLLIVMLAVATNAYADYAEHALIVHRLSNWAPDYLTVTNNWDNMFFSPTPSTLKTLSVITEINGESTKDMEPNDFYTIIDQSSSVTLTYITKIRGENKIYTQQLSKKSGMLFYKLAKLRDSGTSKDLYWFNNNKEQRGLKSPTLNWYGYDYNYGPTPKMSTTLMADHNIDFFNFCTFDYMVAGDDYMVDLGLVRTLTKELEKKGLKYDPNNPDLHVYFTKSADANI